MTKEKKTLEESLSIRYMDLAGIDQINEELETEDLYEPREDAVGGGENLVHPIDHAKVVSDESNVSGIESMDLTSGEVTVTEAEIKRITEKVLEIINLED